jgi:hypothetical protein
VSPGYLFGVPLRHRLTQGGRTTEVEFPATDQFGGELRYFSECILKGCEPEPGGLEGLADVRVIEAIERSLETGRPQPVDGVPLVKPPVEPRQVMKLPPVKPPQLVDAASPNAG